MNTRSSEMPRSSQSSALTRNTSTFCTPRFLETWRINSVTTSGVAVGACVAVGSTKGTPDSSSVCGSGVALGGTGVSVALALGEVVDMGGLADSGVPIGSGVLQDARAESSNTATIRSEKNKVGL